MRRPPRLPGGVAVISPIHRAKTGLSENHLGSGVIRVEASIGPVARQRLRVQSAKTAATALATLTTPLLPQ